MHGGALDWCFPSDRMLYHRTDGSIADTGSQVAWYGFRAAPDGCEIEWRHKTVPSPLPGGQAKAVLKHGQHFDCPVGRYLVVMERDEAAWQGESLADSQSTLAALADLSPAELQMAARRFLALPYVRRWWHEAFRRQAHFHAMRDGIESRARLGRAEWVEGGIALEFSINLWDVFHSRWVEPQVLAQRTVGLAGPLVLQRAVVGQDLDVLLDCARLFALDVPKEG